MLYVIKAEIVDGLYFRSDSEVSRTIRIGGSATLGDLAEFLLHAFDFDREHLYHFSFGDYCYDPPLYLRKPSYTGDKSVREKLYHMNLKKDQVFFFVYDYGDEWQFDLTVLEKLDESGDIAPSILESIGDAEQYPDWDLSEEYDEYEEDDEFEEDDEYEEDDEDEEDGTRWIDKRENFTDAIPFRDLLGDEEFDYSEELFDDDVTEERNPRLGRLFLRVIERQIETKSPVFVEEAYRELQKKGYFRKFAKVLLGNVLIEEIFEILKYHKAYSEPRYHSRIDDLLKEPFGEWKMPDIVTGREHTIAMHFSDYGDLLWENKEEEAAQLFLDTWPLVEKWINENYTRETDDGLERYTVEQVEQAIESLFPLHDLIIDADVVLLNAHKYDAIPVFQSILDTFSWKDCRHDEAVIRSAIAECLERSGCPAEADRYYQEWIEEDPDNIHLVSPYVLFLQKRGDLEKARAVLESWLQRSDLQKDHSLMAPDDDMGLLELYTRAEEFYWETGETDKQHRYADMANSVEFPGYDSSGNPFEHMTPTVRNTPKVYPNDPCPCGSGKKYKKCCGKP